MIPYQNGVDKRIHRMMWERKRSGEPQSSGRHIVCDVVERIGKRDSDQRAATVGISTNESSSLSKKVTGPACTHNTPTGATYLRRVYANPHNSGVRKRTWKRWHCQDFRSCTYDQCNVQPFVALRLTLASLGLSSSLFSVPSYFDRRGVINVARASQKSLPTMNFRGAVSGAACQCFD